MKSDRVERVFLVRMWREAGSVDLPLWRGLVCDVALDCKRYVGAPGDIADFISDRLAADESDVSI